MRRISHPLWMVQVWVIIFVLKIWFQSKNTVSINLFHPFLGKHNKPKYVNLVQRERVKLLSCPEKWYSHSPLYVFWLTMTSSIESTRSSKYTPVYEKKFESELSHWRLLTTSHCGTNWATLDCDLTMFIFIFGSDI